jgi:curli biogenesis system outer membrane secretion channel CsgG
MLWRMSVVVTLVLLVSCASAPKGSGEADLAAGLEAQGRFRDAIAAIDQAISKEPRNEAYRTTRANYVNSYTVAVKKQVAANLANIPTKSSLDLADQLIADAIAAGVSESGLAAAAAQVKASREKLYAELARDHERGIDAMDAENWVEAYQALSAVEELYPNYEDTSQRLARIRQQSSKDYLGQAGRALKIDDLEVARTAVDQLLVIDPQNSIARNMSGKIDQRDNKAYFAGKAAEARAAGNDADLERYCSAVLRYDAGDEECLKSMARLTEALAALLVKEGKASVARGRLFDAADNYFELHRFETDGIAAQRSALQRSLSRSLGKAAEDAVEERQYGLAWALYEKLREVDPKYPELGQAQRAVEDIIRTRTRKSIAVFDFKSPSGSADSGIIVANSLISRLFNNAGRDIKILERENLRSILEEMKLGQIGVVSEDTAKEMGKIHGIDYAIMGSVLLYKVDTRETQSSKTVRYKTGEEIEDNIEYLNWLAVNPKPSKKALENAPLAKVKVPKYTITEYDVVEIKKVGFIGLSFRIVDVVTGENTRVDTIERKMEVKDIGSEGLSDAGIAYDPTEVPTDTELLQMLTDQIIDVMSVDVLRPLQSLEKTYFEKGEEYEKRNEPLRAVESYVDGIFNERLKSVSVSPLTDESLKRIDGIMHAYTFES